MLRSRNVHQLAYFLKAIYEVMRVSAYFWAHHYFDKKIQKDINGLWQESQNAMIDGNSRKMKSTTRQNVFVQSESNASLPEN